MVGEQGLFLLLRNHGMAQQGSAAGVLSGAGDPATRDRARYPMEPSLAARGGVSDVAALIGGVSGATDLDAHKR